MFPSFRDMLFTRMYHESFTLFMRLSGVVNSGSHLSLKCYSIEILKCMIVCNSVSARLCKSALTTITSTYHTNCTLLLISNQLTYQTITHKQRELLHGLLNAKVCCVTKEWRSLLRGRKFYLQSLLCRSNTWDFLKHKTL